MRATMSNIGRLTLCGYFARPEVRWTYEPSNPAAEFGTTTHGVIADAVALPAQTARHGDERVRMTAQQAIDWWWAEERGKYETWLVEPAYVLDPVAGVARMVGTNIGRRYPKVTDNETAGAADLVGGDNESAVVVDWKTGRPDNVDSAEENAQLATLALAVHRSQGAPKVRVVLAFPSTGGITTDEHTLDAYDLAAWESDLARLVQAIPDSTPNPGKKQCQYCPAKAACPAMTSALATMTPARRLPVVMTSRELTSPDHAREQYMVLRAAKNAIDMAWGALRAYADEHGPIDLGDGRAYGPRTSTRESLDLSTRAAVDALRNELGPAWERAVTLDTSKTAIKDAAREAAKTTGESIAAIERRTLEALRAVGAVKSSTSTTYDEQKKSEEAA